MKSILFPCLGFLGCVNNIRKLSFENSLFWDKTLTRYYHCTISTWDLSKKSTSSWLHSFRTKRTQAPGRPPFLTLNHPPTLEASTRPTKTIVPTKIAHSWIPSHRTFFITFICGMRILYTTTNQNQSWCKSHNTIQFFVHIRPMTPNIYPLTNTHITTTSTLSGQTCALDLTIPSTSG